MTKEQEISSNISNFTDILSEQARMYPDVIAIFAPKGSLTYKHLETLVWKMATFLNKHQVKPGNIIALTFRNELALFITMLAVARLGATVYSVPKNTPKIQNRTMIASLNVNFLATDIVEHGNTLLPVLFMDIKTLIDSQHLIDFNVRAADPVAPWLFITGSGSTGKSKIMPVHHQQQIQRMKSLLKWLPLSKGNRVATLVHLDHYVSKSLYLDTLSAGLSIVLFNRIDTKPIIWCKRYNISLLHATVFHIHEILKVLPASAHNVLPTLKTLLIGGSSVPDHLRKQIKEKLTPNLYVRYGINEVGTISVAHAPDVYETAGTVGTILADKCVEIVDSNLQTLPVETVGSIRIKSATVIDGYLDDERATERAFKDGWFYPGDMGKFTVNGQLIHLGRADDMMIMAGNNIYPAEIEHCIISHPNIEDAVALPIKTHILQEVPVCAVVLKDPEKSTEKELLDFTYQRLGSRGPKRIVILKSLKRNEQGKLPRIELLNTIQTLLTRSIT